MLSNNTTLIKPTYQSGIVFYVYNNKKCESQNKYLTQLLQNINMIKNGESHVH